MPNIAKPLRVAISSRHSLLLEGIAEKLSEHSELVETYFVGPTSSDFLSELKKISPSIIFVETSDFLSTEYSLWDILDSIPKVKIFRFDLNSNQINVVTNMSFNANCVNELVDFIKVTNSLDRQIL